MGLRHEVSEAGVKPQLARNVGVLWNLNHLTVKNVRRVGSAADPHKRTLSVGAARVREITKPSAVFTQPSHSVEI
jgi:hypothetical protein